MTTFRKPDIELPRWIDIRICDQPGMQPLHLINIRDPADVGEAALLDMSEAEALLEVLLDICPNAKALANNWLLEEQKREHLKGWKP